jgi:hypothetical protein
VRAIPRIAGWFVEERKASWAVRQIDVIKGKEIPNRHYNFQRNRDIFYTSLFSLESSLDEVVKGLKGKSDLNRRVIA